MGRLAEIVASLRMGRRPAAARPAVPAPAALPAWEGDFPDPFVLRAGRTYFAYGTNSGGHNVQVLRSDDLRTWHHLGDALPRLPGWAAPGRTWAPAVLARGDRYVLYYTVREPLSDRQAISVATAAAPEGPFHDATDGPLVFQRTRGGSIDPSPFVDADATAYLLWKSDDNALHRRSSLWAQRLSPDGLALLGRPAELLRHDDAWERPLIEAPAMVVAAGTYYLFYSANWWESDGYGIGYATGLSPLGPFDKATRGAAWMAGSDVCRGPGGQEFFTDEDGVLYMAFHAWAPGAVGYRSGGRRSLRIVRVEFEDGRPLPRL